MIKLRASKLVLKEVEVKEEREFLNNYHYQGYAPSSYCYGLYQDDELIELMSFSKPRYNKKADWELLRLCTKTDYQVYGGASKLLKEFQEENDGIILSYCNRDKFSGKVYEALGFKPQRITKGYHYEKDGKSYHRSHFTKKRCLELFPDVDPNLSERQIMELKGYIRIDDKIGQQCWILDNSDEILHYIYLMTEEDTGLQYIGQHKQGKSKDFTKDGYKGSGRKWREEVLNKGHKVSKKILASNLDINTANLAEQIYIKQYKPFYNIDKGGKGYDNTWSLVHNKYNDDPDLYNREHVKQYYNDNKEKILQKGKEERLKAREERLKETEGLFTTKQLADKYNVSVKTIRKFLKPAFIDGTYYYYKDEDVIKIMKESNKQRKAASQYNKDVINQIHQMGFITREEKAAELGLSISGFKKRHIKPKGKIGSYNYY